VRTAALILSIPAQLVAQTMSPPPPVVEALPGAGRAIAVEAHAVRREALMGRIGTGVVLIRAASLRDSEREVLQDNDFRQDDYYFYLTGLEAPDSWLVLIADGPDHTTRLYLPKRNPATERWTGKRLGPGEEAARLTGIDDVRALEPDSFAAAVKRLISESAGPVYANWVGGGSMVGLKDSHVRLLNAIPIIDSMRVVKDSVELTALQRAIAITTEAQRAAMEVARAGMYEYQLEATIEYTFRNLGADRVGFPSIVGSGPNSTILHYDVNRRQIQDGDLVVMDIGAEFGQYTADVTRTIPINGQFSERQKSIYNLVLGTQRAAIESIRPGLTLRDVTQVARRYMTEHSGDLCGGQDCNRYFIHGLSHWLGMRVHDVGDYSMPLEAGMVFTVEPGIYIPEENLGVRIEDDVLVTADGCQILSDGAPRTIDEIEDLMRSGGRPKTDGSGQ
jgi:Xaa-Pro aminopeptidase